MTKRILHVLLLLAVVFSFLPIPVAFAAAGTQAVLALTDLGATTDILLRGPFDTSSLRFDLPPTWVIQDGATLVLTISTYVDYGGAVGAPPASTGTVSGALLDVFFNGKLQQSLALNTGEGFTYRVPLTTADLVSPYSDGRLQLTFTLNAAHDCRTGGGHTTVKIAQTSQALLPYVEAAPNLDLRRLPWPIYLSRVIVPQTALVVTPPMPSADELNAAMLVMGAFGRMTNRKLSMQLITSGDLTPDLAKSSELVFVGKASNIPFLSQITLPVPVAGSAFPSSLVQKDDGILQMAVSPWNSANSVLVVSGNTELGVLKAAQALTTGQIQTGTQPTYSVVASVNPPTESKLLNTSVPNRSSDYKFSDLGFDAITSGGAGLGYFTYNIVIPAGQVPTAGASLDLTYSYSSLVNPNISSADVILNDQRVGSMSLSADRQNSATAHVPLPLSLMKSGLNTIEVAASLLPNDSCAVFSFNDLWMTIFPDSTLHLPLTPAASAAFFLQDLKGYPKPFDSDASFATAAFVLPRSDPKAWSVAGQVAYDLGGQATGAVLGFETNYDGALTDEVRSRNLILVGLPSELNTITDLKGSLPGFFEKGSNIATIQTPQVTYRVPANKELGYLELFPSPWNDQRAILTVLGTTANGVASAGQVLLNGTSRDNLSGDFATVDGTQTVVMNTRTGLGIGSLPVLPPSSTPANQDLLNAQIAAAAAARQRQIVLSSLGGLVVIMALVAIIAILLRRRGRTQGR
ncbi:MAG TPA: cellulose biosynthesis cyclic di-GMP-binding regulatory protein BcsB [Anaerolineales bacterium]